MNYLPDVFEVITKANEHLSIKKVMGQYTVDNGYSIVNFSRGAILNNIENREWIMIEDDLTGKYEQIGSTIGKLVDTKNKQYGDAFNKSSEFLNILYPNGVKPEQYSDMLAIVRVFDKLMRIANGNQGEENAWNDLVGYGILKSEVDMA